MLTGLAVSAVVLVAIALISVLIAFLVFGPHTVHHFGNSLDWSPCSRCTAGTQWLYPDSHWGPIPDEHLMIAAGHEFIEAPQGNIRNCPHCQLGGWWHDPEEEDTHDAN